MTLDEAVEWATRDDIRYILYDQGRLAAFDDLKGSIDHTTDLIILAGTAQTVNEAVNDATRYPIHNFLLKCLSSGLQIRGRVLD